MSESEPRLNVRLRVPVAMFVAVTGLLTLQRAITWIAFHDRLTDVTTSEWLNAIWVGLVFDVNIACTLVLPVLLLVSIAPARSFEWRAFRGLLVSVCAIIGTAMLALVIADYFFFGEYNERLNDKTIDYLGQASTWKMLWQDFPLGIAIVVLLLGHFAMHRFSARTCFPKGHRVAPLSRGLLQLLLLFPLVALGIRGTFDQKAINTSMAYVSNSFVLAQWSLNGAFTLRETILSRMGRAQPLDELIDPLPDEQAFALSKEWLLQPEDTPLGNPDNPLLRVTDSGRPRIDHNVVLVMLESLSWHYVESMGGETGLSPVLDGFIDAGVLMERCFAVGTRTSRGISGTLAGYPDLPGASVTTRIETEGTFLTLAEVLRRRGYQTVFIHAGEASFDHLQGFTRSNGFEDTVFGHEFSDPHFGNSYGWCDADLYSQSLDEIDALADDGPFFATLLTLSFHRPYEVPEEGLEPFPAGTRHADELLSARYADKTLGDFVEQARQRPWFDNTLFVFVADHAGGFREKPRTAATFRVPFVMYGPQIPGLREHIGRRIETICSQTDVAPTILSTLGGSYDHCFFGSNVLSRPVSSGFALLQSTDSLALMGANGDLIEFRPGRDPRLFHYEAPDVFRALPSNTPGIALIRDDLQRHATALMQSAARLFSRRSYRLPREPSGG